MTLALVGAPLASARADETHTDVAARAFEAADRTTSEAQRRRHLRGALDAHVAGFTSSPSWKDAAGAMTAAERLELAFLASAWYWLATDNADYTDEYVSWQSRAVTIFDRSATVAFDFTRDPVSLAIDGEPLPAVGSTMRPLTIAAGERDPRDPVIGPPTLPPHVNSWEDPIFVATVIGTIALAAGIAVGGGYVLLGEDNPKSFDTAGGVALIITELCLIGGGTALALLMD